MGRKMENDCNLGRWALPLHRRSESLFLLLLVPLVLHSHLKNNTNWGRVQAFSQGAPPAKNSLLMRLKYMPIRYYFESFLVAVLIRVLHVGESSWIT